MDNSQNPLEWLPLLMERILASPEFRYAEGNFTQKLESVCYYHLGSLCYPAELLLAHFFKTLSEKFEISLVVQDIKLRIIISPVYNIPGDGAIMAQDVNQVFGPVDISEEDMKCQDPAAILRDFKPRQRGEVLISSPSWCKARYLIEAVIYQFEREKITDRQIVVDALEECFQKCRSLHIKKLAMDPLGAGYNDLSCHSFVEILHETLIKFAGRLKSLREIIIAASNERQCDELKKAFADILNIVIP